VAEVEEEAVEIAAEEMRGWGKWIRKRTIRWWRLRRR